MAVRASTASGDNRPTLASYALLPRSMTPSTQTAHFIANRWVELPFGGMKHSGCGREKGFEAPPGFAAFKTIAILNG